MRQRQSPPPRLPGTRSTPPLPSNQDDATATTGWVGIAIAIAIFLLLLLFIALFFLATKTGGAGGSSSGNDMENNGMESGGSQVPEFGEFGSKSISDKKDVGANDDGNSSGKTDGNDSSGNPNNSSQNRASVGNKTTNDFEDDSIFESNGQVGASSSIPSGTIAIGNITGTAEFMGVRSAGGPVSYIIDFSGSMQGGRFDGARNKLIESVNAIRNGLEFNVFLYSHDLISYNKGKLAKASNSSKRNFENWINSYSANGGTLPVPAIEAAIKSGTKNIFLLSDGEYPVGDDDRIIQLCKANKVVVHCFSLQIRSAELEKIAKSCGGAFQYIP